MSLGYVSFDPFKKWLYAILNADFTPGAGGAEAEGVGIRTTELNEEAEISSLSLALIEMGLIKGNPEPSITDASFDLRHYPA